MSEFNHNNNRLSEVVNESYVSKMGDGYEESNDNQLMNNQESWVDMSSPSNSSVYSNEDKTNQQNLVYDKNDNDGHDIPMEISAVPDNFRLFVINEEQEYNDNNSYLQVQSSQDTNFSKLTEKSNSSPEDLKLLEENQDIWNLAKISNFTEMDFLDELIELSDIDINSYNKKFIGFVEQFKCQEDNNIFSDNMLLDNLLISKNDKIDNDIAEYFNIKQDIFSEIIIDDENDDGEEIKSNNKAIDEIEEKIINRRVSKRVQQQSIEKQTQLKIQEKLKKEEEEKKKEARNNILNEESVSLASGVLSNSQCSSRFLYELSTKIKLNPAHFNGDAQYGPKNYSDLFNICCKIRNIPEITQKESRDLSSLKIVEKTQFSDIWGKKMLKYARYEEGDGLDYEKLGIPKCYITKVNLVKHEDKVEISTDSERACSEMEHKLPCVTAFSRAPNYMILSKYRPTFNQSQTLINNYLQLWKAFVDYLEETPENFNILLNLYKQINFVKFEGKKVSELEDNVKNEFAKFYLGEKKGVAENMLLFNWCFLVIKFWLHELAYSHHISNQEKSINEIALSKRECKNFFAKLKKAWSENGRKSIAAGKERSVVGPDVMKALANKNKDLESSLRNQFIYMKEIIDEIDTSYRLITNVEFRNYLMLDQLTDESKVIQQCKKILIMKNMLLSYKIHKKTLDTKKNKKKSKKNEIPKKARKTLKKNIIPKRQTNNRKRARGGTKKRVRFKVSRKVYRKLEHK